MKTWFIITGLAIVIAGYAFYPVTTVKGFPVKDFPAEGLPVNGLPETAIAETLLAQIDGFTRLVRDRLEPAVRNDLPGPQLQQLFLEARLAYKKFEWAAEYFNPVTARFINGAPVPEAEPVAEAAPGTFRVQEPRGLQVIESFLFPGYDTARKQTLLDLLRQLPADGDRYKIHFKQIGILPWQVFDAAKLEIFRLEILGIAGFDAPLSKNGISEAAASLESLRVVLSHYTGNEDAAGLIRSFRAAENYLGENSGFGALDRAASFDAFDRAAFITTYGNSLSIGITRLLRQLNIPVIRYNRLLRQEAETLFDKDAFNADAYVPGPGYVTTPEKIALGKMLFSDPVLSGARTRSCASCHQPDKAFADGLVKNTVIDSRNLLPRNTPTLLNAALQPALFYDGRASTLEDQVRDVLRSPIEMQSSVTAAARRLWQDTAYRRLFSAAFPTPERTAIDTLELMNALGAYVRSLVLLNSRFDDYMRGDPAALSREEIRGFNLFMGKARCGTCHYLPLFNGTFPPRYTRSETEVIGAPVSVESKAIDGDMGSFAIVPASFLRHAFKTSTVRNAARTAPYMHNGVFADLQQMMDFYNNGGGAGAGLKVDNQTLLSDSLHLTTTEISAVISFIRSMDSRP